MEDGLTMARGLLMLSPLPRLMLIPTMVMDTTLDTMAGLTMAMVDNGATYSMEDGPTMARDLLMLNLLPRLMLIPSMDMDTTLDTVVCLTLDMVVNGATLTMAMEDNGGKFIH